MNKPNPQAGIVLVSVLIIVALISASVVLMFKHQNTVTSDIKMISRQANAIQYLFFLENSAKVLLKEDLKDEDSRVDEANEDWAKLYSFSLDNADLTAQLFDLQQKLNINNIFKFNKSSNELRAQKKPLDFFGCFNRLNLLVNSDINGDNVITYLNQHKLRKVTHPSALRKMIDIDSKDYQKISNFLFALDSNTIKININTASKEILRCLHLNLDSDEVAQNITNGRPYKTLNELKNIIPITTFKQIKPMIDVKTDYFVLEGKIQIDNLVLNTTSILKRNNSKIIKIINRSYYLNNESY